VTYEEYLAAEAAGFEDDPSCECPVCFEGTHFVEEIGHAFEAPERARVVGVLDAWRKLKPDRWWDMDSEGGLSVRSMCVLHGPQPEEDWEYFGDTPDAARAAAAKAIEAGEV
jgi:hypothetical protein